MPHTNTSQHDCVCAKHTTCACVLEQIIQQRNRSQTQQLFSTPCLGADKGRLWDLWPQMRCLILGRESIWGLASLVMNYSTSMPPWVPVVGSAETESRGFDWQSLWSYNSHAVYDQCLSERGKTRALLTRSPSELSLFCSFHFFFFLSISFFDWTLNSIHLCFLLFFSHHLTTLALSWVVCCIWVLISKVSV